MSFDNCGLIVFLRLAEKGKVKKRIADALGDDAALAIYRQLSKQTLQLAADQLKFPVCLFYDGGFPGMDERDPTMTFFPQCQGSLGEKMRDAFEKVLSRSSKAIIVGSDCPYLNVSDLQTAAASLSTYDLVIGPAKDGGYYLLGCKALEPALFEGIHWSTTHVLQQTIEKANALGLTYHLMRTLDDIDTESDWIQYQQYLREKLT